MDTSPIVFEGYHETGFNIKKSVTKKVDRKVYIIGNKSFSYVIRNFVVPEGTKSQNSIGTIKNNKM
jgi:hypothetical protein